MSDEFSHKTFCVIWWNQSKNKLVLGYMERQCLVNKTSRLNWNPPPVANSDYPKSLRISNFPTHDKDPVYVGKDIVIT